MKWTVSDTITCPSTATFFSLIVSERKHQIILWYYSEDIIEKDSLIIPVGRNAFKDGESFKLDLLKTMPGDEQIWHCLKRYTDCPGTTDLISKQCSRKTACAFDVCPWGKEKRPLVR